MPLSKVAAPDEPRCDHMGYRDTWSRHRTQCRFRATCNNRTKCGVHSPERIAARKAKRGPGKEERGREALRYREAQLMELVAAARDVLDRVDPLATTTTRLSRALEPYDAAF